MPRLGGLEQDVVGHDVGEVGGQTVVTSTRYTAIGQVITQGSRFASTLLLARLLTPADFGIVAIAVVVSSLLDQFKDMGTGSAIIQRSKLDQMLLNSVFYLNVVLGLVAAAALAVFAGPIAAVFDAPRAEPVVRAFALITLVTALGQIHHSLLRRSMRFKEVATIAAVSSMVTAVVAVTAALMGLTYWALVIGTFVGAVVELVMLWRFDRWRPTWNFSRSSLQSIWKFSWNLFLSNMVFFSWMQADKVIVGRFVGDVQLGVYTIGQRLVTAPLSALSTVIHEVTFPAFARRQDDNAGLRSGFSRASAAVALVTFPLMIGLAVVAVPLVRVVFGAEWSGLAPLVMILAPAGAVQSVTGNCGQIQVALGRSDWTYRFGLVYLVVLGALELLLSPFGLVGVATGYAIGTVLLAPFVLMLTFTLIELKLRDYLRDLWPYAWMTAVMAGAVLLQLRLLEAADISMVAELGASVGLGVVVYVGLLHLSKPPAWADLREAVMGRVR